MIKAVIVVGGPQKGTRFRPLSLNCPKPLFPIAGIPMIEHLIKACVKVSEMKEIILIGFYQLDEMFKEFIQSMILKYRIQIRYLQEYVPLGTAGGIYHFRDMICLGEPDAVFLINGDVCGNFDLEKMLTFHRTLPKTKLISVMATEATRSQSLEYGCIVENKETHEMLHYVEKPSSFVSNTISCGVYLFSLELLNCLSTIFLDKHQTNGLDEFQSDEELALTFENNPQTNSISLENDVLSTLLDSKRVFVFQQQDHFWWSPIKTPGSAIYANRNYLNLYRRLQPNILSSSDDDNGPKIVGDVYIHPTAIVDPTATIGPNVSISEGVKIGAGVRIKESIILKNVNINNHSLIMYSIVGWNCAIGFWSRVEGTPCDPNPNKAFAKMDNLPLFDGDGKLNPLITVLGCNVQIAPEIIVLNSVVLPYKEINRSYKNEIIL